ncbi:hypothetical protein [Brucella sp. NBRC 12950]|uniref:hypothetical protein n=1 Tax=Brucella sp. NBRC 12950 TaxID=2994518 RepID=UPI00249FC561|nr:hypothetical protein [Brucella sp. NBRC 12950]GLU29926.1 hypothetical protein Brsp01_51590 [Brucella sp. NBRC 12950]
MKWSELAALCNSSVAKITILTPILGTFILFNQSLGRRLDLKFHEDYISGGYGIVAWLHQHSMEFLYFGLLLMGVATFLFQLMSPMQMKLKLDSFSYAAYCASVESLARLDTELKELLIVIADSSTKLTEAVEQSRELVNHLFGDINFLIAENRNVVANLGRDLVVDQKLSAVLIAREVLKPNLRLRHLMGQAAQERQVDLYYCNYKVQDELLPKIRKPIAVIAALSLFLLIVPTLTTILVIAGVKL